MIYSFEFVLCSDLLNKNLEIISIDRNNFGTLRAYQMMMVVGEFIA
jgi:hypothetical protein